MTHMSPRTGHKAKARTKDLTFKAKARLQDWTFKAKARTKNFTCKTKARTQDLISSRFQGLTKDFLHRNNNGGLSIGYLRFTPKLPLAVKTTAGSSQV